MKLPQWARTRARAGWALARKGVTIGRQRGLHELYRLARRKLFPPPSYQAAGSATYETEALYLAERLDVSTDDLARSRAIQAATPGPLPIRSVLWYLPHFEHAYYGGVYTILRFAAGFAERHGVTNTFLLAGTAESPEAQVYLDRIAGAFGGLRQSRVVVARSDTDLVALPADASVATFWTTAYAALKNNRVRRKFYFVQDFEPMFYQAGSISAQAEASYRFGLYGLANTVELKRIYESYGGTATSFDPCVDTSLFHPPTAGDWPRQTTPYTVFFYARPNFWRNGFEIGATALRQLKTHLGAQVRIVSAGQQWRPADYGLDGVIENLGLLSLAETAHLYRTCDVGLAMMFTRHPSYLPFELMASGCLVVANINDSTNWLLRHEESCLLSLPTAGCIAETLARGLEDGELRRRVTRAAQRLIQELYTDWDAQIERIYRYMCNPVGQA